MASSKRERELARMRAERQAARRAAEQARRKARLRALLLSGLVGLVVAVVVIVIIVNNTGGKSSTSALSGPSSSASAAPTVTSASANGTCTYTKTGTSVRKIAGLPPETAVDTKTPYRATIVTNRGNIVVDLATSKAPCTVNSFRYLASQGYYGSTPCHRLSTTYFLQCGDPGGTGTGGPGYSFGDENLSGATYPAGTLAMANSGANTNGSQFFLVFGNFPASPAYTPFGKIVSGLDVLKKVAAGGVATPGADGSGKPKLSISIEKVTVAAEAAAK